MVKAGKRKKYRITVICLKANDRIWSMENSRLPFCSDSNISCDFPVIGSSKDVRSPLFRCLFHDKNSKGLCHFGRTKTNWEVSAASSHEEEFLFTAQP